MFFFIDIFQISSPGVAVIDVAQWNFVCYIVPCITDLQGLIFNLFLELLIYDVFIICIIFFMDIFDLRSPGGRCNWPSAMK